METYMTFVTGFFLSFNFWLCWVFTALPRLSLVSANGGYSLVVVHGLLTAGVSLAMGHSL